MTQCLIFNILTKLYNHGIRRKRFDFLSNSYLTSKAKTRSLDTLSSEYPIPRGYYSSEMPHFHLSCLFFFINDGREKYGINLGNKRCYGGLFF